LRVRLKPSSARFEDEYTPYSIPFRRAIVPENEHARASPESFNGSVRADVTLPGE
jgi:hypothetical protein